MEPEINKKNVRFYEIDLLRFVAAIVVVLYHFTYRGYHADNINPIDYPELGRIFKYGYLGVELFFIISGYVVLMSAQGKTVSQFFVSRVTRLYPAYWVACTLCFLVINFFGPDSPTPSWSFVFHSSIGDYIVNLTMFQAFVGWHNIDGVYWTLSYEILFYFLIAAFISFGWLKNIIYIIAIWLAYCIFAGPSVTSGLFSILFFPRYAPYFISGMLFYLLQNKQSQYWKIYALLFVSYVTGLRSARTNLHEIVEFFHQDFSLVVVLVIITSFFIVFLLIANRKISLAYKPLLAWAGALIYPLYLLHHNMGYIIFENIGPFVNKYVLLVCILIFFLVGAYLLHILVERSYSKKLASKLSKLLSV